MMCQTFEISRHLHEQLVARSYPVKVHHGPETLMRESFERAIVVERDLEAGDSVEDLTRGTERNPRKHRVRQIGVVVTAYVQSTKAGAAHHDHEALCDELIDAVIVEIDKWCVGAKTLRPSFLEARYLNVGELSHTLIETWAGVAYRLRFRFTRAVNERDYDGNAAQEVLFNDYVSLAQPTLEVS